MPSTPPSLVKFAGPAGLGQDRRARARRRRATTSRRRCTRTARRRPGHADDRRGGVVRADERSRGVSPDSPVASRTSSRSGPTTSPGGAERRQAAPAGRPSASTSVRVPRPAVDVEQAGGRGVRALGDAAPDEPEAEQVRDQQHRPRGVERRRAARRRELVDRVERQELEPGPCVQLGGGMRRGPLDRGRGPRSSR